MKISKKIQELERTAFKLYNTRKFSEAFVYLKQILELSPKHSLATLYLARTKDYLKQASSSKPKNNAQSQSVAASQTSAKQDAQSSKTTTSSLPKKPALPEQSASTSTPLPESQGRKPLFTAHNPKSPSKAPLFRAHVPSTKRIKSPQGQRGKNYPATTRRFMRTTERIAMTSTSKSALTLPGNEIVKVLIVDDSPLMRKVIIRILKKSPSIEIVGEAVNGEDALEKIPQLKPDVITLDVNMPVMDGITALKHILIKYSLPVIMLSAFTEEGVTTTFDCLSYGSVGFIAKPSAGSGSLSGKEQEIIEKVLNAHNVKVSPMLKARVTQKGSDDRRYLASRQPAKNIILMGGGEGGYQGFLKILPYIPENLPAAILAVQYMEDSHFIEFSRYLNQHSHILVKQAEDGESIKEGVCYFCNQGYYLKTQRLAENFSCQVSEKPSFLLMQQNVINQLLFSAAEHFAAYSIAIILSGQGIDGLEGIKEIKRVKGMTLAIDPKSCTSRQLGEIAINSGYIDHIAPDSDIPGLLWHLLKK